jgi:hypothetical protein
MGDTSVFMTWCLRCMFLVCYMMLIYFIFDGYMEQQGKSILIIEIKSHIIEGDPTYLVIIYLLLSLSIKLFVLFIN